MRIVQNCHTTLKDVFVEEEHKLVKAKDFQSGANIVLGHSRPVVCWNALGICLGVYDHAIKYVMERKQFGRPVAGNLWIIYRISISSREIGEDYG